LVNAYGNPTKLSFNLVSADSKLYIYLLAAGDFGVSNTAAKIVKYELAYTPGTKEISTQPAKSF
jgi:hypothetical protein